MCLSVCLSVSCGCVRLARLMIHSLTSSMFEWRVELLVLVTLFELKQHRHRQTHNPSIHPSLSLSLQSNQCSAPTVPPTVPTTHSHTKSLTDFLPDCWSRRGSRRVCLRGTAWVSRGHRDFLVARRAVRLEPRANLKSGDLVAEAPNLIRVLLTHRQTQTLTDVINQSINQSMHPPPIHSLPFSLPPSLPPSLHHSNSPWRFRYCAPRSTWPTRPAVCRSPQRPAHTHTHTHTHMAWCAACVRVCVCVMASLTNQDNSLTCANSDAFSAFSPLKASTLSHHRGICI